MINRHIIFDLWQVYDNTCLPHYGLQEYSTAPKPTVLCTHYLAPTFPTVVSGLHTIVPPLRPMVLHIILAHHVLYGRPYTMQATVDKNHTGINDHCVSSWFCSHPVGPYLRDQEWTTNPYQDRPFHSPHNRTMTSFIKFILLPHQ